MKKLVIVLGVLVLAVLAIQYSRRDYLEFSERREDWHRRCDAYMGSGATGTNRAKTGACQEELNELLAYATRKGWTN